jgi:hypothetical protein
MYFLGIIVIFIKPVDTLTKVLKTMNKKPNAKLLITSTGGKKQKRKNKKAKKKQKKILCVLCVRMWRACARMSR